MTVGLASATATAILNVFRGTTYTAPAGAFIQLHTGDPGAAGTANVSGLTTRNAIAWAAPSAGSMVLSTLGAYTMNTSETITHVSLWSASSAGTFLQSFALTSSVPVVNGSTLTVNTFTVTYTPIAA